MTDSCFRSSKCFLRRNAMDESPIMSLVYREGVWRVRIVWPEHHRQRYFGRFASRSEAQRWVSEHQQMLHRTRHAEGKKEK
jgi:hypothetical protein